jgi:hypothetical protein
MTLVLFIDGPLKGELRVVEGRYFKVHQREPLPSFSELMAKDYSKPVPITTVTYRVNGNVAHVVDGPK